MLNEFTPTIFNTGTLNAAVKVCVCVHGGFVGARLLTQDWQLQ